MNGPEHYREAEDLLAGAMKHRIDATGEWRKDAERHRTADALVAEAQVHAALAQAAAAALPTIVRQMGDRQEITEWARLTAPGEASAEDTAEDTAEIHLIVNEVLKGHPTVVYDPDSGERDESRECRCIGCHIARRTGLRALVDVRRDRAPVDFSEPPF